MFKSKLKKVFNILNIIVFINFLVSALVIYYAKADSDSYYNILYNYLAQSYTKVSEGEVYRFITAGFVHFSVPHFAYNMFGLYVVGRDYQIEKGEIKILIITITSIILSNITSFSLGYEFSGGASSVIFGILGAWSGDLSKGSLSFKKKIRERSKKDWLLGLVILVFFIVPGFFKENINNIGHISGAIAGILATFMIDNEEYKYKKLLKKLSILTYIALCIILLLIGFNR